MLENFGLDIALPVEINYYKDQEECENAQPSNEEGRKMELGKQFYKDYMLYTAMKELEETDFEETVTLALITVQRIGKIYASNYEKRDIK